MDTIDKKPQEATYIPDYSLDASALAYVKPITTRSGSGFAVHAADGSQLAVFSSRDAAIIAARQHDLELVELH